MTMNSTLLFLLLLLLVVASGVVFFFFFFVFMSGAKGDDDSYSESEGQRFVWALLSLGISTPAKRCRSRFFLSTAWTDLKSSLLLLDKDDDDDDDADDEEEDVDCKFPRWSQIFGVVSGDEPLTFAFTELDFSAFPTIAFSISHRFEGGGNAFS